MHQHNTDLGQTVKESFTNEIITDTEISYRSGTFQNNIKQPTVQL